MKLKNVFQIMTMLTVVFLASCKKDDEVGVRPTVTATDPINKSTSTGISSKVSATFSVAMDPASITSTRFTVTKGTVAVAGTITYTGLVATFTPTENLSSATLYTATITTGAHNMAGISMAKDYVWTFTTGAVADVTAPTVTSTVPLALATGVSLDQHVAVTFSEPMDLTTISSVTFYMKQGTTAIAGTVTYNGSTATFAPGASLTASKTYTVTVTTGAKDVAGNALASNQTFTFTTGAGPDTTLPMVNSTNPLNNATGVSLNKVVDVTFSEAMDPLTINSTTFTFKQGTTVVPGSVSYTGNTATFTPTNLLTAVTDYTATVTTGAKDLAGNALAANLVLNFTTGSTTSGIAAVNLGAAGNYVILAKTAINNSPTSAITGDLGLSPAATSFITGFALTNATGYATASQVTGKVYAADMAAPTGTNLTTAVNNMITAYNDAAGRPTPDFSELGTGNIGGKTLASGLYKWTSTVTLPSDVTISGGSNDVWIFQISGDLTVSNSVNVTLVGGAQAKNIFWQVAGTVTVGTTSHMEGVILSMTGITFQTGASFHGRALAQTAVILDSNAVTKP